MAYLAKWPELLHLDAATGSTAFMIVRTMLVALMTPSLALFYGGLSRRKNVVTAMTMVMAVIGIMA